MATPVWKKLWGPLMPHDQMLLFTQQLASLISAGVPLLQALQTMAQGIQHQATRALVLRLQEKISQGQSLHRALAESDHFDSFYCQIIAAGELSGNLQDMLKRLALNLHQQHQLRQKVRKALIYPVCVLLISLLVLAVILIWVVPVFQTIFASFGAELPLPTRLVLHMSQGLMRWGLPLCVLALLMWFLIKSGYQRSESFQMLGARVCLRLPVLGPLLRMSNLAIWTRCMATLVGSSVPLLDSLEVTAGVCPNRWFGLATLAIRQAVSQGRSMAWAMQTVDDHPHFPSILFPSMLVQMMRTGEETGALAQLLEKSASDHESSLTHQVESMTQLIEPLMVVVLGGMVGGLVVALYLPVFELGQIL